MSDVDRSRQKKENRGGRKGKELWDKKIRMREEWKEGKRIKRIKWDWKEGEGWERRREKGKERLGDTDNLILTEWHWASAPQSKGEPGSWQGPLPLTPRQGE